MRDQAARRAAGRQPGLPWVAAAPRSGSPQPGALGPEPRRRAWLRTGPPRPVRFPAPSSYAHHGFPTSLPACAWPPAPAQHLPRKEPGLGRPGAWRLQNGPGTEGPARRALAGKPGGREAGRGHGGAGGAESPQPAALRPRSREGRAPPPWPLPVQACRPGSRSKASKANIYPGCPGAGAHTPLLPGRASPRRSPSPARPRPHRLLTGNADKLNTAGITAICSGYRCRY